MWKFVENKNKSQGDNLHCACIKDFEIFLYNKTNDKEKMNSFMNCLQCFSSEETLTKHQKVSWTSNQGSTLKVLNFHKQLPSPFPDYGKREYNLGTG